MDDFRTIIVTYQDASGRVYTSRTISNNPKMPEMVKGDGLAKLLSAWGYELISAYTAEELHCDQTAPGSGRRRRMIANFYRVMIMAVLMLAAMDFVVDRRDTARLQARLDRLEVIGRHLAPQMDHGETGSGSP